MRLPLFTAIAGALLVQSATYESPDVPLINATGTGWEVAFSKAQSFLAQLTLGEKANITTGVFGACVGNIAPISRLGFSGLCLQDGPLGIRAADYVSSFPAGLSVAASWDKDLAYERGVLMAAEFRDKGAHVALGPVVGPLGRHADGGRNWEGFSPDPSLSAELVVYTIKGMQDIGVQACVKHYIGNEQETQRSNSVSSNGTEIDAVSANIDDRTMHELYSWPFAAAVKAGVASVMCSYNRVNGSYACQNSKILNGILKDELGFQGYVMSDWGGTHSGVYAIESGLDMTMPGPISFSPSDPTSYFGGNLTKAVNNGSLELSRVDDMILRIMTPYFHFNQESFPAVDASSADIVQAQFAQYGLTGTYQRNVGGETHRDVRKDHGEFIRKLGAASHTLLKNTNNALPLKSPPSVIGVFGNDAADEVGGVYGTTSTSASSYWGFDIGTLYTGGGSGAGRPTYVISPLDAIKKWANPFGTLVHYITDNEVAKENAATLIPAPQVCLVFVKSYASEGIDRLSLDFDWDGSELVESIASFCNNTIVITHSTGPNLIPWAANPNITAIIAAHIPGQESGNSLVDVISGKVNPSGKLPFTIAYNASDYGTKLTNLTTVSRTDSWQSDFTEGLYIDYRHFDEAGIEPRYEFGFGLSYTQFNITDLSVSLKSSNVSVLPATDSNHTPGGNRYLYDVVAEVSFTLSNVGDVAGSEVAQLYLSLPSTGTPTGTPVRVLRGFEKVYLYSGLSQDVTIYLTRKDLSYWDAGIGEWKLPRGQFTVNVGFSSRNFKGEATFNLS